MYLLYLDESGDPNGWQSQKHFVLGGVAVHEGQVYRLTNELDGIQNRYFPGVSYRLAFHVTDIRRGKGHFQDFAPNYREQILSDLYDIIQNVRFPNLVAFATAIHLSAVSSSQQVRHSTLEDVCQRFNTFLSRQYKTGYPTKGMLIIDRTREEEYRTFIDEFQRTGTKDLRFLGNIIDIPYFARCHETRLLQLADLIAHAVFRYYERAETKHFDTILPRFDRRSPSHPPDGLKHITREPCSCCACSWRG